MESSAIFGCSTFRWEYLQTTASENNFGLYLGRGRSKTGLSARTRGLIVFLITWTVGP